MSAPKLGPKALRLREMRERNYEIARNPAKFAQVAKPKKLEQFQRETLKILTAGSPAKPVIPPVQASAKSQERPMAKKTLKTKTKTKAKPRTKKSRAKAAAATTETPSSSDDGPRAGSKMEKIQALLTRPEGCTAKEVLNATSWPTVSMPQQAKSLGLTLRKEKRGRVTQYFGEAHA